MAETLPIEAIVLSRIAFNGELFITSAKLEGELPTSDATKSDAVSFHMLLIGTK